MRGLVVRSPEAEGPVQLGHQTLHALARGDYEPDVVGGGRLVHPPHGQGGLCLAVVAEEGRVADDAVYAAFEVGCCACSGQFYVVSYRVLSVEDAGGNEKSGGDTGLPGSFTGCMKS